MHKNSEEITKPDIFNKHKYNFEHVKLSRIPDIKTGV